MSSRATSDEFNASASDEFGNDSDIDTSVASEDSSDLRFGMSSAASYDCHSTECVIDD